jgi:hypothetical protein
VAAKPILLSAIAVLGAIVAVGQTHQAEGEQPYTPTRREWIAARPEGKLDQSRSYGVTGDLVM